MEENKTKIKSFTDLYAWKEAHKLVVMTYKMSERFPQKETFGLTNQLRRAAVSISSNIAEGFSRNTDKDKFQFYTMAQGSLTELQNQLLIAHDVGYLTREEFKTLADQSVTVHKLIHGLKRIRK